MLTFLAEAGAVGLELIDVLLEAADAFLDRSAFGFEFGFAGTPGADTTALAGHRLAASGEAGQHVFELGEFDLEFARTGLGALGEDVEDDLGAIDDVDADLGFEVAGLDRGKVAVEDDEVCADGLGVEGDFLDFAFADDGLGVGTGAFLEDGFEDFAPGGFDQATEFGNVVFEAAGGHVAGVEADDEDAIVVLFDVTGDVLFLEVSFQVFDHFDEVLVGDLVDFEFGGDGPVGFGVGNQVGEVGAMDVAGGAAAAALEAAASEGEHDEGVEPLHGHGGEGGFGGGFLFEAGRDAADAAEAFDAVAGEFEGGDLGLAGGADADADDLATPIDVDADGLGDLGADGGDALGKFGRGDAVSGQALVVEPLELFDVAGF